MRLRPVDRAVLGALLPSGASPLLPQGLLDTGFEGFLVDFDAAAPADFRRIFRLALVAAGWVAPLLIGRMPPMSRLNSDDRERALAATFFGGLPGTGREWVEMMAEFPRAAVWVLPLRAYGEGSVGRSGSLSFKLDPRDLPNLRRGLHRAVELMFEVGARAVVCPIHGLPRRLPLGQSALIESAPDDPAAYPLAMSHLFGSARMSLMPEAGVVGPDFRVHGTENLYVVDSSIFPTNLGVNPQLTIMALARLAAEGLAA